MQRDDATAPSPRLERHQPPRHLAQVPRHLHEVHALRAIRARQLECHPGAAATRGRAGAHLLARAAARAAAGATVQPRRGCPRRGDEGRLGRALAARRGGPPTAARPPRRPLRLRLRRVPREAGQLDRALVHRLPRMPPQPPPRLHAGRQSRERGQREQVQRAENREQAWVRQVDSSRSTGRRRQRAESREQAGGRARRREQRLASRTVWAPVPAPALPALPPGGGRPRYALDGERAGAGAGAWS